MHTIPEYPTDQEALEMHYRTQHPFFVYGTLRPGRGNVWCWEDIATPVRDGQCWVNDYRLIGTGFPYAVPSEGSVSTGCLIFPDECNQRYELVRRNMDHLEGFPAHYDRIEVPVHTNHSNEAVIAWMYVPARFSALRENMPEVPRNSQGHHDWSLA